MKVAIIGAGHSGLVAARHIKDLSIELDIYERRNTIGGVWRDREESLLKKDISEEEMIAISPVYDTLRTNTPTIAMQFDGLMYNCGKEIFVSWTEINKYLKAYYEKFGLQQYILLQTEVIKVYRKNEEWLLRSRHSPTGKLKEKNYNALVICSGHEEIPFIPQIKGASSFQGVQIHSKRYRNPKHYQNQNVLIIGAGPSGIDIALQISTAARTVYLSHHSEEILQAIFPGNIVQKPDVKIFANDSVTFVDDSSAVIDTVIYCTGYKYNYDYFDESCGITVGDNYVKNLYKEMICIEHPTLIFCGLHKLFFVIILMELQAKLVAKLLAGKVSLPSKQEMLEDTKAWEEKRRQEGRGERQFFNLEKRGREYMRDLARIGSLPDPPEAIFEMFDVFYEKLKREPAFFRKHCYQIINGTFVFKPYENDKMFDVNKSE